MSELCGIRWKHTPTKCQRWGTNPGSIRWNGAKVPVEVPRVRNTETNQEVPLETYKLLHQAEPGYEQELARSVLLGLSQRKYGQVAQHLSESFGLSGSTTGRVFINETAKALETFMSRRFDETEFVAILIDGKTLRSEQILLVVGLTGQGQKIILGFMEVKTEAHPCGCLTAEFAGTRLPGYGPIAGAAGWLQRIAQRRTRGLWRSGADSAMSVAQTRKCRLQDPGYRLC